ncbi:hypothetical protein M2G70_07380 [Vibrio vulnificus]|nr:hypothetical protein [Vibrio vulnificus]
MNEMILNLQVKVLAVKEFFSKIKHSLTKKKKVKAQNEYMKACESFNFIINPFESQERYIALNGELFRVKFLQEGVEITNEHSEFVTDKLKRLQILNTLQDTNNEK